jgi:peptidoglycan hydrolase CwlO-like protein
MNTNTEFWGILIALAGILITIIGQALYIAFKMGRFEEKLNNLEKKQDKHNNVIERTAKNEASISSAHKRLDEGEEHFKELSEGINEIKKFLIERGAK